MKANLAPLVQSMFNRAGYQIRRVEPGVSYGDPMVELSRLAGPDVRQVIEIGAADGRDTLKFSEAFPKAQVYAFEPLPENYAKLAAAVAGKPNIIATNAAVSDKTGRQPFYVTDLADASSLFKPSDTDSSFDKYMALSSQTMVDVVQLDQWTIKSEIDTVDILKMDAQGAELGILTGSTRLLSEKKFGVIYSEVLFMPIYAHVPLYHHISKFLEDYGYRLHNLYNLVHNQKGELAWGDAIFVRAPQ
jgi:FkbM family methyltransferase